MNETITWIDVRERLPEKNTIVMCWLGRGDEPTALGFHWRGEWFRYGRYDGGESLYGVTHWAEKLEGPGK